MQGTNEIHIFDWDFCTLQDVIPHALKEGFKVIAYHHEGFWKDITTLRAFYDINLELTKPNPPLSVSAIHRGIISRGTHSAPPYPPFLLRCYSIPYYWPTARALVQYPFRGARSTTHSVEV